MASTPSNNPPEVASTEKPVTAAQADTSHAVHHHSHKAKHHHAAHATSDSAADKSPNAVALQLAEDIKSHMQSGTDLDKKAIETKSALAQNPNVSVDDIRKAYGLTRENYAQHVADFDAIRTPPRVVAPEGPSGDKNSKSL